MDADRKLAARRFNERVKLAAGFLNALAVGAIGAGAIIPATRTPIEITWTNGAWIAVGIVLHSLGHGTFNLLRSED